MMKVGIRTFYPIRVLQVFRGLLFIVNFLRRTTLSLALATTSLAALAITAPIASAIAVETDRDCYLQQSNTSVTVRGSGFTAGLPFTVLLDGQPLTGGAGTIGDDGSMTGSFAPPSLKSDVVQRRFVVGLTTANASPSTSFTLTRLLASFWPTKGSVADLRVRFSLFGFGLGGPVTQVYVHYISPTGHYAKTVALGRPTGQCGAIPKTTKRRLFPLQSICTGTWRLQFDTRRRFTLGTSSSSFLYYTVKVRVKARSASTSSAGHSCR